MLHGALGRAFRQQQDNGGGLPDREHTRRRFHENELKKAHARDII